MDDTIVIYKSEPAVFEIAQVAMPLDEFNSKIGKNKFQQLMLEYLERNVKKIEFIAAIRMSDMAYVKPVTKITFEDA